MTQFSKTLNLVFPQWQDSGRTNELYRGAQLIKEQLLKDIQYVEVPVVELEELEMEHRIIGFKSVLRQLLSAREIVEKHQPSKINTVGGGCGVEVLPISYLNQKYENLGILWFDAHGDINTPEDSESNHPHANFFHGMPLRTLLGEGEQSIVEVAFSKIQTSQIIYCGVRDLDPPEVEFIKENTISLLKVDDVTIEMVKHELEKRKIHNVYIHIDLDVLDSKEFPWTKCPTLNGLSLDRLTTVVHDIYEAFNVVGTSILEFAPSGSKGLPQIKPIIEIGF